MDLLKRYSISFGIAGVFLYFFTIWVEEKNESRMPHNLSNKKEEKNSVTLVPKRYYEKCVDLSPKSELKYGISITDSCVSLDETGKMLTKLYTSLTQLQD